MNLIVKLFAGVLAALVVVVSLSLSPHCESDHDAECSDACACVSCHVMPAQIPVDHGSVPGVKASGKTWSQCRFFSDRLSVADIFRPPISA